MNIDEHLAVKVHFVIVSFCLVYLMKGYENGQFENESDNNESNEGDYLMVFVNEL